MSASVDFSALDQECAQFAPTLFAEALVGMESAKVMTVKPGVKDQLTLTEMSIGSVVKGWSKTFNPVSGAIELKPRILQVRMGKVDIEIYPEELRQSWLGMMMKPGVNQDDLPFERFILQQLGAKIQEELELEAIYNGVRSVGTPTNAGELFDGFGKLLDDAVGGGDVTETVTGAITSSNALDAVRTLWEAASPRLKRTKSRLYVSDEVYLMYCQDYQSTVGSLPYNTSFDKVFVDGSGGRCEITPVPSMGGSQRMLMTPEWNLVIGTDLVGDTNKINYDRELRSLRFAIDFAFGVQFGIVNDNVMVINDQA